MAAPGRLRLAPRRVIIPAHIASADAAIASAALAIAAGQRPTYDNRINNDESNLQWVIRQAGGLPGLTDLVRGNGARPTEVELTFRALGPALTRVSVEHRGWAALTEEQLTEDCALPGGYLGGSYATGWTRILARMVAAAEDVT